MKKLTLLLAAFVIAITANAQFEQGKKYISASLSGLDLTYNGSSDLKFGFQAKGGYFLAVAVLMLMVVLVFMFAFLHAFLEFLDLYGIAENIHKVYDLHILVLCICKRILNPFI